MTPTTRTQDLGIALGLVALVVALVGASRVFPGAMETIMLVLVLLVIGALFRWPSAPILILYPILWVLGPYQFELVGGRVERAVAAAGLLGTIILLGRRHSVPRVLPTGVYAGIVITLGSYLLSWFIHPDQPDAGNTMMSLTSRVLFLFLIAFHVTDEAGLRTVINLFIASTLVACAVTFWIGWEYGFGYIRDYHLSKMVRQNVPEILQVMSRNMNQATGAGVLLLGLYPSARTTRDRLLIVLGVLFLFWMAFAAEFRREILVTIPIVLGYLYLDKRSGLSRIALPLLVISVVLFLALLLPTSTILQERLERETPLIVEQREPRMVSFAAGLSAFFDSPVVGYGPNSYASVVYPRLPFDADPIARGAYNVLIWIAVEAGILGLIGVITVLVGTYLRARKLNPVGTLYADVVVRLGPLLMVLILVWFSFGNSWDGSVPWFLMGLIFAVSRMSLINTRNGRVSL
jgi:hypothetical protein